MRFVRGILYLVVAAVVLTGGLYLGARFMDGPLGFLPGGALRSGERVSGPVADWSFAADVDEIELQLLSQERSRTTWIAVHEGRAFVPASLSFPPGKSWHFEADVDGAALLRIEGRLYPVELSRVRDPGLREAVIGVLRGKYPPPPGSGGGAWIFEVRSRGDAPA